jgi:hypothetical protein
MAARRADLASAALPVRRHSAALAQPTLVAANLDAYARMRLDRRPTTRHVRRLPRPKTCGGAWAAGIASAAVRRRSTPGDCPTMVVHEQAVRTRSGSGSRSSADGRHPPRRLASSPNPASDDDALARRNRRSTPSGNLDGRKYALRQPRRPESVEPLSGGTATAGVERPLSFR